MCGFSPINAITAVVVVAAVVVVVAVVVFIVAVAVALAAVVDNADFYPSIQNGSYFQQQQQQ